MENKTGSDGEPANRTRESSPVSTEGLARAERRTFTAEYKLRILQEADHCKNGELGALLRREGLYSSHLTTWRKERNAGRMSTATKKRGPKPSPLEADNMRLRKQLQRTEKRLEQANAILDAQKKLFDIFVVTATGEPLDSNCDPSSKG